MYSCRGYRTLSLAATIGKTQECYRFLSLASAQYGVGAIASMVDGHLPPTPSHYYVRARPINSSSNLHVGMFRLFCKRTMTTYQPIVFSGPSGSGKSTLVKKLMGEYKDCFAFSVSHTTRKPRPGEVDGKDYYYVSREDMEKAIANGEFIEHAQFSGNMYGTSKKAVRVVSETGRICILDIDMQGVKNIKQTDLNPRYIFVKPPSFETLEARLRGRGTESEDSLKKRLDTAKAELLYAEEKGAYDHIIVNDNLDVAYEKLKGILLADINLVLKKQDKTV